MRRYTTPTIDLTVEGWDLSGAEAFVTFRQGPRKVTFDGLTATYDGTDSTVSVSLSQLQTAQFQPGVIDVQVNWVEGGTRNATEIRQVDVGQNLLDEEV